MSKDNKKGTIIGILIIVLLILSFIHNLQETISIEKSKQSGNERWKQVEQRIINIENRVEVLEIGRDS